MERYNRAWRDPKSPLTPLTPLTTHVFNFETSPTSSSNSPSPCSSGKSTFCGLNSSHLDVPQAVGHARRLIGALGGRRFSEDFMRLRSVFSPGNHDKTSRDENTSPMGNSEQRNKASAGPVQPKRHFKRSSPVDQPELSPRVSSLLNRTGNSHLAELFKRQEIDLGVLVQMTIEELESLGVRGVRELKLAIDVAKFAKKFI